MKERKLADDWRIRRNDGLGAEIIGALSRTDTYTVFNGGAERKVVVNRGAGAEAVGKKIAKGDFAD